MYEYNLVPGRVPDGLRAVDLGEDPMLIALPRRLRDVGKTVSLAQPAGEKWIVGSRQSDDVQFAERACSGFRFAPRLLHSADDCDLVLRMVAADLGVGFVPRMAVDLSRPDGLSIAAVAGTRLWRRIRACSRPLLAEAGWFHSFTSELACR